MNNSFINPCFSFPHLRNKLHKTIYLFEQSVSRTIPVLRIPSSLFTPISLIIICWSMWTFCQRFCLMPTFFFVTLTPELFQLSRVWHLNGEKRVMLGKMFWSLFPELEVRFALWPNKSRDGNSSFCSVLIKIEKEVWLFGKLFLYSSERNCDVWVGHTFCENISFFFF